MDLKTLLAPLQQFQANGSLDLEITGISYNSRKIRPGDLFVALPGEHTHGIRFLPDAEKAGATAVLTDTPASTSITTILVQEPRLALAKISNLFYGYPSSHLQLFGITGTNGKTTSSFLLRSILEAASLDSGLIGTVQYSSGKQTTAASLTTPEAADLQRMFAEMLEENRKACVMEVSSHSLKLYRVAGCKFEGAIFTNLTQDHLDFHKTMEEYFQAKLMLFDNETCETKLAVVNIDDSYGKRILEMRRRAGLHVVGYGFGEGADYRVIRWNSSAAASDITIQINGESITCGTPLIAKYNAYNICGAFAAAHASGLRLTEIVAGIEGMRQVPGRLERIDYGQSYMIIIDYAHTEDAIRQILATVRPYSSNQLIILFGCGGERDRGKRPLMGKAAGQLADVVILTSDNPRSEDPEQIIREVQAGVKESGNSNLMIFSDRTDAIQHAIKIAAPGDVLVLAGKGHENYQIVGTEKLHFDEREVLREALSHSL